jgi:hypothetical protein
MAKSNPRLFPHTGFAAFLSTILVLTSCGREGHTEDALKADLSVPLERLDQDLFRSARAAVNDTSSSAGNFSLRLYAQYGPFFKDYVERILQAAPVDDPRLPIALTRFAMDPDWSSVQEHADSVLGDMKKEQVRFEEAFERLKGFFPDSLTPRIIVFNSGFNYGVVPTDSVLGIGVEWFVARDSKVISYLAPEAFPQYVKERMRPELLVPSAVKAWLQVHYTKDVRGEDVLTNLVEIGKVMYLLDRLLPETDPAFKFAFTNEQLKWCEDNEFNIWKELVAKQQLYSKKAEDVDRLLNDGPFTNGFPHESPGHIGEWIGYRMVESYMKDHENVTVTRLFENTDPRIVLKSYKPR